MKVKVNGQEGTVVVPILESKQVMVMIGDESEIYDESSVEILEEEEETIEEIKEKPTLCEGVKVKFKYGDSYTTGKVLQLKDDGKVLVESKGKKLNVPESMLSLL